MGSKGVILFEFDRPVDQDKLAAILGDIIPKLNQIVEDSPMEAKVHLALWETADAVLDEYHRREG